MLRIKSFKRFESSASENKVDFESFIKDCQDILLELQDDYFSAQVNDVSDENTEVQIQIENSAFHFKWKQIKDTIFRLLDYIKLTECKVKIEGHWGTSTSGYKYFKVEEQDLKKFEDHWYIKLVFITITF